MSVEFMHPLRLLALPACAAVILAICLVRRSRSRKERISHGLRYVLILLAALALAGMSLKTASPDRTAFLLVDVSASVNEEETVRLAKEALAEAGERKTGVIAFGADAAVLRSPGQEAPLDVSEAQADRSGTDLYGALQMASALLPEDSNGGIAVISDGLVTGEEDLLPAAGGLPVNVLKTGARSGADAQVTSVIVPSSLYTGQCRAGNQAGFRRHRLAMQSGQCQGWHPERLFFRTHCQGDFRSDGDFFGRCQALQSLPEVRTWARR